MDKRLAVWRGVMVIVLLAIATDVGRSQQVPTPYGKQPPLRDYNALKRESIDFTRNAFRLPETIVSAGGSLRTRLEANLVRHTVAGRTDQNKYVADVVELRCFNGNLLGPTLRVRPGDILEIRLENRLPVLPANGHPSDINYPHDFNSINLHTHGLHVSPKRPSDDISLQIAPGDFFQYQYQIPRDHPAGTFWYHPHHHGSVAIQVASGMAGALIVEGGLDNDSTIAAARERIFVFQQLRYCVGDDGIGRADTATLYDNYDGPACADDKLRGLTLINGVVAPEIEMRPGAVERWRIIHAGIEEGIKLKLVASNDAVQSLHEIARDGLALGDILAATTVQIYPGYRSDVLVQAGPPGIYYLVDEQQEANQTLRKLAKDRSYLARVIVRGKPIAMHLPTKVDLQAYLPFTDVADTEITAPVRTIALNAKLQPNLPPPANKPNATYTSFEINGASYADDATKIAIKPGLGTSEEWLLQGVGDIHPFHIHVNPFQVIDKDAAGNEIRYWKDTLAVANNPTRVRMRFLDHPGRTVMHCHILDHEDQGMMQQIEIVDPAGAALAVAPRHHLSQLGGDARPGQVTDWQALLPLPVDRSEIVAGRAATLLVLHRGVECAHCSTQLQALRQRQTKFQEAGVQVVAIGAQADATTADTTRLPGLPFPAYATRDDRLFKELNCWNGAPLHGTFLIDRSDAIRWHESGEQPFMQFDELLDSLGLLLSSGDSVPQPTPADATSASP